MTFRYPRDSSYDDAHVEEPRLAQPTVGGAYVLDHLQALWEAKRAYRGPYVCLGRVGKLPHPLRGIFR